MINPVTPWTSTAQSEIQNGDLLHEVEVSKYTLKLYNAGNSIWLTSTWPNAGSIAFRLAYGINSDFDQLSIIENEQGIIIRASTKIAEYRITLSFPSSSQMVLRYTTKMQLKYPMIIPFWPRDIVPLTKDGMVENTGGNIHTHQVGSRSGHLFFSMTKPRNGSVFYFQNLTSISEYCDETETSLRETVGGKWSEIGFRLPCNRDKPLSDKKEFTISDAFVLLSDEIQVEECEIVTQFINNLASVYILLPKPESQYYDWPSTAKKVLKDLHTNKGCWKQIKGIPYLNAYVGDYSTPAEIMVQLSVLVPLMEYLDWSGEDHPLFEDIAKGLKEFYDERLKSIVRWHPALEHNLDRSEEHKREMVMDSWYLHHPLLNLSRMALKGNKVAEQLFLGSIDYVIKVAHHFNYEWPVLYKMTTLEVLKAETTPGEGGEKDVPGTYVHIMLMAWKLTGEKRFKIEVERAVKSLDGLGFDIFYQANNTAFTAVALLELFKETKESRYLELSYCCLGGIFKNVHLWDCKYGHSKNFPNFFSVFPLDDAPYTAPYEELEVYAALHEYLQIAEDVHILPSLKILIPEFVKYTVARLPYYYPIMLPKEMLSEEVKTVEIQKDLWIPLEDLQDGWDKSGKIGQEVYGAGLPFAVVPRQYFDLGVGNAKIFVDYPITTFRRRKNSATFHTVGSPDLSVTMILLGFSKTALKGITVQTKEKSTYKSLDSQLNMDKYKIPCGVVVRIKWGES